jgi:DNA mismatch repair protein MutL
MIRVLPRDVADRIAAGEVVERPASVVKELVENALDAGATNVRVDLEDGGVKLVRVVDDGCGMTPEDLGRCVLPHATSKIADVDDLFRVATYGFRGEALPSIGSVSRLDVFSRRKGAPLGARIVVDGGDASPVVSSGGPEGTCVEVRNLFFNTPARRAFLKQERAEAAHVLETLTRLALPDPEWSLTVSHQGRKTLETLSGSDRRERAAALFGDAFAERLLSADGERGGAVVSALLSPPDLVFRNTTRQYLFLNGRWIRDRRLSHAIVEGYRGRVMHRDYPAAFVFLSVDPATVDVNVHPTKSEVRFRDPDALFGLTASAIRRALDAAPGAHRVVVPVESPPPYEARAHEASRAVETRESSAYESPASPAPPPRSFGDVARERFEPRREHAADSAEAALYPLGAPRPLRFLQAHRSYVVVEAPEGLRIVDQHALHERKLYDELRARAASKDAEDQLLLVPEILDTGPSEREALLSFAADFAKLGLRVEPFGEKGVALRSVPSALRRSKPSDLLATALELVGSGGVRRDALLDDAIATIACKAAVKFNDALPEAEIRALLDYEAAHPQARNCPHGRNTTLVLTHKDLENRFQRKK